MAESIETFVRKLQADGVQAGREAAEKIRIEAQEQARRSIAEAEAKAKQLIADAHAEKAKILARGETELQLASRDAVLRLQGALSRILRAVLIGGVQDALARPEFLRELIHEIVRRYVQSEAGEARTLTLNVSSERKEQLAAWATQTLRRELDASKTTVDFRGTLAEAGFEYKILDGTVEVTADSVVAVLSEMLGPPLRELIARGASDGYLGG